MSDLIHSQVKPSRQSKLTPATTEFTGVTQKQVDQAPTFQEALGSFKEWLGEDTYYLCTWGPDDKYQLISHRHLHKEPLDWLSVHQAPQQ
ncbi:exonuclease domain-containing protein [Paenibacillus uliginis]|uniref:exonuclease domain-containing protein n=1 Tax=Paenibacillus uliginis TaxID=683737 RepID=UPI001AD81350|nr:exonuclease domain-containing protein [Paenibacillus uliginis]